MDVVQRLVLPEDGCQIGVDFEGQNLPACLRQGIGQSPQSGPYFQDELIGLKPGTSCDFLQDVPVDKEILAKTLFEADLILLHQGFYCPRACQLVVIHSENFLPQSAA